MKQQTIPKDPPPPLHRLRDNELFQHLYGSILGGLFSRFEDSDYGQDLEDPKKSFEAMSARMRHLVLIGHQAALHAHCQLELAEPYTDQELANFNQKL